MRASRHGRRGRNQGEGAVMNKDEIELPRCSECGSAVKLTARPGRTREYRPGVVLPIPDDFEIPTCVRCGEEFIIPEVSEPLDARLDQVFLGRQAPQTP